jgi:hypothetical protein
MNIKLLRETFPDFNFDSLTQSRIPRIRVLFLRKNFKYMQKDLNFVLKTVFSDEKILYTLNQLYWVNRYKWKIRKSSLQELRNLWLGDIYNHPDLVVDRFEWWIRYSRILQITYSTLFHLSIIDAWWGTWRREIHWLPSIEMDNFFFSEDPHFLIHVNFILLDPIDWDGLDISSYDKAYLYEIAESLQKNGFTVLVDKIEEFNV